MPTHSQPENYQIDPTKLHLIEEMMQCYVADGKSAGMVSLVSHMGKIIYHKSHGFQDIASQAVISNDSIFRIYSMTKPITSVALMMLLEQYNIKLDDAAHRWIPRLKTLKVYQTDGSLKALERNITIGQLLTHTAGFSYGFDPEGHPVDKMYERAWRDLGPTKTLAEMGEIMFDLPLIAQPGSLWHYSIATDICGYLVELISDLPFGDFLQERILGPLEMVDTDFFVPEEKRNRFATLYGLTEHDRLRLIEDEASLLYSATVVMQSGGGGLVSTAGDYWRFCQMMLNGGSLDGVNIISPGTVKRMTQNQVPMKLLPLSFNGVVPDLLPAYGFGLGFAINMDPAAAGTLGSLGDYGWGGMADTYSWSDPKLQLVGILMQQLMPSMHFAGRQDFRNLVYQSII